MTPMELIGTAQVPGGQELRLFRRGRDFMILLDRNELMSSRMSGSEEALAVMSCARLEQRPAPHMLIGGYGMGFTLRAALARLGTQGRVTVALQNAFFQLRHADPEAALGDTVRRGGDTDTNAANGSPSARSSAARACRACSSLRSPCSSQNGLGMPTLGKAKLFQPVGLVSSR